jgi:hypothetical protein
MAKIIRKNTKLFRRKSNVKKIYIINALSGDETCSFFIKKKGIQFFHIFAK